jgi:hypothetical protein
MITRPDQSSPLLVSLDLAEAMRPKLSMVEEISMLIRSLRDNYFSYGLGVSTRNDQREARSKSNYYGKGFFAIPRINLPRMKSDSPFIAWSRCVNEVYKLLDGSSVSEYVQEIMNLELKLIERCKNDSDIDSVEVLLENILCEFEIDSGFSSVFEIKQSDGNAGILTAEQFKTLLIGGHPLNDNGAGVQHGHQSHRLQFYLLGQIMRKNISRFFSTEEIANIKLFAARKWPEMFGEQSNDFNGKIVSIFYRLLGMQEFNDSFDWEDFYKRRQQLNLKYNNQSVPEELNTADIWVQLFDRYGYAGYFSVPSTFGFLQNLGIFKQLPKIGEPRIDENVHLKRIIDVTPHISVYR